MNNYDSYKDSGVDWMGDIPSHWNSEKIKNIYSNRNEKNLDGNTNFLSVVKDVGVVLYSEKGNVGNKTSDDIYKYKIVYENDLVINPMNIIIGSVGLSKYFGSLSNVYIVLESQENLNPSFGFYIFKNVDFQKNLHKICYGIMELRESLNKIEFYVEKIPLPPLKEQQEIVSYLDKKTSSIDSLIQSKKKKIELLKEKRTSLINQVVNKGLNPDVEIKDSGVEWIGSIPFGWVICKVKHITKQVVDGTHFTPTYTDDGVPFLRVTDIHQSEINLDNCKYISVDEHLELKKRCSPEKGDLLLSKNGTIGVTRVVTWDWEFSIFVSLCLLKFRNYSPYLFSYYFQSNIVDTQLFESSKKSTVTNLHLDKIRELLVILPPLSEQHQIVEYLDKETKLIDETISSEQKKIELLKEYKQSLISEVVTGKRKVTTDE